MRLTGRTALVITAGLVLAAVPAQAQVVEDSIDVGCAWVGSLAYNSQADVIYGASEDGRFLTIDCATNTLLSWLPATGALSVVYDSTDNKAYCSIRFQGPDSILVVDGQTHTRLKAISMPSAAMLVWDSIGDRVYVSCDVEDRVGVIDCRTDSVIAMIPSPGGPVGMDVNTLHRKLYVRNWDGYTVSVIDMQTNQVIGTLQFGNSPASGCYMRSVDEYYCSAGSAVYAVCGATDTVLGVVDLPTGNVPRDMVGVDEHGVLMVASYNGGTDTLYVVDVSSDTLEHAFPVGREPSCLSRNPAAGAVYCANAVSDDLSLIRDDGSGVYATLPVGSYPFVFQRVPSHGRTYVGHLGGTKVYVLRDTAGGIQEGLTQRLPQAALRAEPSHFRGTVRVEARVGQEPRSLLGVYDEEGARLATLGPATSQNGLSRWCWDGRGADGRDLPAGVYVLATQSCPLMRCKVVKMK